MKFKNQFSLFFILMLIWVLLNNTFQLEVIIVGFILSVIISFIFGRKLHVLDEFKFTPAAFFYTFVYLFVFFKDLVISNLIVAKIVITPSLPINPGIIKARTVLKSKMGRMILTNSITLTPGTLTVDIIDDMIYIHSIDVCCEDVDKATDAIIKKFEKILVKIYG